MQLMAADERHARVAEMTARIRAVQQRAHVAGVNRCRHVTTLAVEIKPVTRADRIDQVHRLGRREAPQPLRIVVREVLDHVGGFPAREAGRQLPAVAARRAEPT